MGLNFILGSSGSGKSQYCLEAIAQKHSGGDNSLTLLMVPDQFSFQAEKDVISAIDGRVIMRVKVLSFTRLAHTVFAKTGCIKTSPLTEVSKAMVLRKIVLDNRDNLVYYKKAADKQGFTEQLSRIITEFFRYMVSPETLKQEAEAEDGSEILKLKLKDLSLIYEAYTSFIDQGYLCDEETLDLLYNAIDGYEMLRGADVWIDGFSGFTPQEFKIIERLLNIAAEVNVVLSMDSRALNASDLPMTNLFFETKETYNTLCRVTENMGLGKAEVLMLNENPRFKAKGLLTLEKNYGNPSFKGADNSEGIEILCAANPFDECEAVALKIIELVRDKNYRYRDIAVMAGSLESYETVLRKVMAECEIPFFMDIKRDIASHPLSALVKGVMEIFIYNFSFDSVFNTLKTYLTPMERNDVEVLENYCLAHGIKSYKWNLENWSFGLTDESSSEEYLKINGLKNMLMSYLKPLMAFKNPKKEYSAKEITLALFSVLENMHVTERLDMLSEAEERAGMFSGVSENRQCWNMIIDIMDSLTTILGDTKVTLKEYYSLFDNGISVSRLGLIPPTVDNVAVGTLERTRLPKVKALFVVGANDGVMPSSGVIEGVLKDDERNYLERRGITLANDGVRSAFEEQFLIYSAITKPEERLYISYPNGDLDGRSLLPSPVINGIIKMFPQLSVKYYGVEGEELFSSPAVAFHHLGDGLKGENKGLWQNALKYYENNDEWKSRALLIKKGLEDSGPEAELSRESCRQLFGNDIYSSVSRLERFASCPYSYFMAYTMKASERAVYQLRTPDLGLLFHSVLEDFSYMLKEKGLTWQEASREEIVSLTEAAVDRQVPNIGSEILLSNSGLMYLVKRLKRISIRAATTLAQHLKSGEFSPFAYELGFGNGGKLPPIAIDLADGKRLLLTGKIDRVDIMNADGSTYVKIIDYKSGKKAFSLQEVYYGLQMQLLIYLDALMKNGQTLLGENILPGGVFYFRIADPMLSADSRLTAEEIEEQIAKQLSMSGLVLRDDNVILAMDKDIGRSSKIIPAGYKTTGEYTAASMVASRETYERLCSYTISSAAKIGSEIKKGVIYPSPYKNKGYSPCSYCVYSDVCGFDESERWFKKRNLKPMDNEEIFKKLEEWEN